MSQIFFELSLPPSRMMTITLNATMGEVRTLFYCLNDSFINPSLTGFSPPLLNTLLHPKMTSGHCFPILSADCREKKYPPPSPVVGWSLKPGYGGGATHPIYPQNIKYLCCEVPNYFLMFNYSFSVSCCHKPGENRIFLELLWSKTNVAIFVRFLPF